MAHKKRKIFSTSKTIFLFFIIFSFFIVYSVYASKESTSYKQLNTSKKLQEKDSTFQAGKALFKKYCTFCHHIKMDRRMTGPALGGVTKRREKQWLYRYTRESYKMHQEGDSIALLHREVYGGSMMNSFPMLSDIDLDILYYFIEKRYEMTLQGIPVPIEFEYNKRENNRAKACKHILSKEKDILEITVSLNRFWRFNCVTEKHKPSDWKKTTLQEMFDYDNSINILTFTTNEFPAKRVSKDSTWQ